MAGIVSAITTLYRIGTTIANSKTDGAGLAKEVFDEITKNSVLCKTNGSITKLLSKYIIEPTIICSKDASTSEVYDKVLELQTDVFAAYFTQAFQILSTVHGLHHAAIVDMISTDNAGVGRVVKTGVKLALESGETNFIDELRAGFLQIHGVVSTESGDNRKGRNGNKFISNPKANRMDIKKDDDGSLRSILSRSIEITIPMKRMVDGKEVTSHTVILPMTIKCNIITTPLDSIINLLDVKSPDTAFRARLDEYRSGGITFRELVFAGDLIEKYKKQKKSDGDELIKEMNDRLLSANVKALNHKGVVGYEKSYSMIIISNGDKLTLDRYMKEDITKNRGKRRLLDRTNSMTLTVLDEDYQMVTLITADISGSSTVSYKAISKRKDSKGSDMSEIIKAMMAGRPLL